MLPEWQTGIVRCIEQVTHNTRSFFIELPEAVDGFAFKAGQFVTLDLPIHEQRNRRWRSYSIASAPDGTNVIELLIVLMPGGGGTEYLFTEIQEGSELTLRGPHGVFVLPDGYEQQPLILICTGTGVAPFRSMASWMVRQQRLSSPVHLICGYRTRADLLYHAELETLSKAHPAFQYHPTLSRETWGGATGYVHPLYEALCAEKPTAQFMLCGWKAMVDEAKARILAMGYDKKQLHYELYG